MECAEPGQLQRVAQGQCPVDVNLIQSDQGHFQNQHDQNQSQKIHYQGEGQGQEQDSQDWQANGQGQIENDVNCQIHVTGQGHFEMDINLNKNDQGHFQNQNGQDEHQNQEWEVNDQGQLECADLNQIEMIGQGQFPVDINLIEVDPRIATTQESQDIRFPS